jgi:hypothetical protein
MIPYLTILRFIGPYLIAAVIGGAVVGKIQQTRINYIKKDLIVAKQELSICQDANKTNQETIGSLKTEVKNAYANCDSRLKIKDKVISNIRKIDNIGVKDSRGPGVEDEKNNSSDLHRLPLLGMLNSMFGKHEADSKN